MPYASTLAAQGSTFVTKIVFNNGAVLRRCSFNKEPICWLSCFSCVSKATTRLASTWCRTALWGAGLGHRGLLSFGGLRLRSVATLQALVAEQVIGRRLPGFDDEDALGRQRGEHGQRVHVSWDPGQRQEAGKRREV